MSLETFDARKVQPQQGTGGHPAGIFPFTIINTYLKENSAKTGAMLVVELTSDAGRIENRYNVVNPSPQAMEIAQKELSALCHAVNIFMVSYPKDQQGAPIMDKAGYELRGGRGRMEVVPQLNKDGTPNGYMEVKKVFDVNGNEPGKQGSAPQVQPQPQGQAPMQQQPGGGWAAQPTPQQAAPQQPQGQQWANPAPQQPQGGGAGWGSPQPQQQQPAQPQPGNGAPPWAK